MLCLKILKYQSSPCCMLSLSSQECKKVFVFICDLQATLKIVFLLYFQCIICNNSSITIFVKECLIKFLIQPSLSGYTALKDNYAHTNSTVPRTYFTFNQ